MGHGAESTQLTLTKCLPHVYPTHPHKMSTPCLPNSPSQNVYPHVYPTHPHKMSTQLTLTKCLPHVYPTHPHKMSEEEGMVALDVVFVGLEAQGVEVRLLTRSADLHGSVERFGPNLQCSAGKKTWGGCVFQ